MVTITLYAKQKKRHRCTEQTFGLWEKARVGCFERTASKHVYFLGWNRSPAQVACMRQMLRPGALGRPRGTGWRWRWEGGSGWGIHVNLWLIHVNVWQKPLQYKKKIKNKVRDGTFGFCLRACFSTLHIDVNYKEKRPPCLTLELTFASYQQWYPHKL